MALSKHNRNILTLCFNVFFPTKGNMSMACELTIALTLPSNLSKSGILRRYCATTNMISGCITKASTTLSLLLICSTFFNGWQIQLLKSRFPEDVIQLSRCLNNVPEIKKLNSKRHNTVQQYCYHFQCKGRVLEDHQLNHHQHCYWKSQDWLVSVHPFWGNPYILGMETHLHCIKHHPTIEGHIKNHKSKDNKICI